jgi:hypothetical protein
MNPMRFTIQFAFFLMLAACQTTKKQMTIPKYDESTDYILEREDTVIIDQQKLICRIYSDVFDENHVKMEQSERIDYGPKTLVLISLDGTIKYDRKFYNQVPRLYKSCGKLNEPGRLFVSLLSSGGGSGFTEEIYWMDFYHNKLTLEHIVTTTELSLVYYHPNDQHLIVVDYIWGMGDPDSDNFESHFSAHRCEVSWIQIGSLVATKKHLFTTAKKYEMPETEEAFYGLLNQLFQGENRKFEGLTIAEYLPEM